MQNKKQMFNLIEDICRLNEKVWDQHAGDYNDIKEAAYQIEEALEGFDLFDMQNTIRSDFNGEDTPKEWSRLIVNSTDGSYMKDVDRFDKHIDSIYFNIGSLHKLGLTPYQIVEGLQVVHNANLQKSGTKDSQGKVIKPSNFVNPESQLQKILDNRHG